MFRIAFHGVDHPHGAGWRESLTHVPDAAITAIVPDFQGATTSLEERLSQVPRFADVDDLVAYGEFDGAIVCLSNDRTVQAVEALSRAGKHVLIEKPTAGSAADARRIGAAVTASKVAYQNGYMWRYDAAANRLREMVADGRFGQIISVEMTMVTADVARRGPGHYLFDREKSHGGFFNWLACHYLDLLLYITDQPVTAVTARVGNFTRPATSVEDGGTAILELGGGGLATFTGGYWVPRWSGESGWTIRGTDRWVHWDPSRPGTSGVLEIHGPQPQFMAMDEVFSLPVDPTTGYGGRKSVELIEDWIRSAASGGSCRNTTQSATQTLDVIDRIYQSSAEGRRIECL